jgi:hypothetical protein
MMNQVNIVSELRLWGNISYFSLFASGFDMLIEAHENYQKGGFRNRYQIIMSDGIHLVTVPLLKGKNQQTAIRDVKIDYSQDWSTQHLRTIKTAYGSAPFFDYYFPEIEILYTQKKTFLWDLNKEALLMSLNWLKIENQFKETQYFIPDYGKQEMHFFDLRFKKSEPLSDHYPLYSQIFMDKQGFIPNASILDLLFCQGPQAIAYLENLKIEL